MKIETAGNIRTKRDDVYPCNDKKLRTKDDFAGECVPFDKDAIERIMSDDSFTDPVAYLPQSPVTVEVPFLGVRLAKTKNGIVIESTDPPPLQLPPTCMDGDMCELSKFPTNYDDSFSTICAVQGFEQVSVQALSGTSVGEVIQIFTRPPVDTYTRISTFWKLHVDNRTVRERVEKLLDDGGIRLERRKRMGAKIAPEEKKAIRAQRNRERSQALRRHHKRRLALLEEANKHLQVENGAIKAMILALIYLGGGSFSLHKLLCDLGNGEVAQFLGFDVLMLSPEMPLSPFDARCEPNLIQYPGEENERRVKSGFEA